MLFSRKSSQNSKGYIVPVFDQLNKKLLLKNKTKQNQGNFLSSQNDHTLIALRNFHLCNRTHSLLFWFACQKVRGAKDFVGCRNQPLDEEEEENFWGVSSQEAWEAEGLCLGEMNFSPFQSFSTHSCFEFLGKSVGLAESGFFASSLDRGRKSGQCDWQSLGEIWVLLVEKGEQFWPSSQMSTTKVHSRFITWNDMWTLCRCKSFEFT